MTHAFPHGVPEDNLNRGNRPIRILELRSVRGPGGGPEKTILLGAAQSDPSRFQVTVCYIRDLRDRQFGVSERAAGLDVDYIEITERHSFDPAIWRALRRVVREKRIDIVHAHEHKTDLLALLLARADGVIPLSTAHGWSGLSARERFYYFFDRRLLARYPMVIAVSEAIRRTLIEHGARPSSVRRIHNGIDPADFKRQPGIRERIRQSLEIPGDTLVVGALGRLEDIKRFDVLLEAFAGIREHPTARLVIAGDGSNRRALEAQAHTLGIGPRVMLLGQRDDIRHVHQALDVYVQSSDSEGVPNAVLEAMALETPVVATDVGGTREIVDDGVHGLLVARRDPGALSRAIERTVNDRPATAQRVTAARRRIEQELSFAARMAALEQVYEELMTAYRPESKARHAVA